MSAEQRLRELNLVLPKVAPPAGQLTSDLGGFAGYGLLVDCLGVRIQVAGEGGFVCVSQYARPSALGEVVRILASHVCPVSSLSDCIALTIDARERAA